MDEQKPPQEAFPTSGYDNPGMTLLDYFAGQALTGLLTHHARRIADGTEPYEWIAEKAYTMARIMMKTREAGTSSE